MCDWPPFFASFLHLTKRTLKKEMACVGPKDLGTLAHFE